MGVAGFSVPFGSWVQFFRDIVRRDVHNVIADRIFLMPIVEPHVIDGSPTSVAHGRPLNQWLTHGVRHPKAILKFRLRDLYDRHMYHEHVRRCQWHDVPFVPAPATQASQDLDDFNLAVEHEGFWRSGHLGPASNPPATEIQSRNNGRNDEWQRSGSTTLADGELLASRFVLKESHV
jgi:hypothetical protein